MKKYLSKIFAVAVSAGISLQVHGHLSAKTEISNLLALSLTALAFGLFYKLYIKWFSQPSKKRNSVNLVDNAILSKQSCNKV